MIKLLINLLIPNDSSGAKIIAMGIIGGLFFLGLILFRNVKESGVTSKSGRNENRSRKKQNWIDEQISQLKIAKHRKILTEEEFETKLQQLKREKRKELIELYLKKDEKYKSINDAHKKGFITQEQKEVKFEEIRDRIRKHIGN
jgi:biopolymer transport protein ExbB/TolQ